MLSEAIKDEGIEEKLIIKDILEIVKESVFPRNFQ